MRLRDKMKKVNLGTAAAPHPGRMPQEVLSEDRSKPVEAAAHAPAKPSAEEKRAEPAYDSTNVVLELRVDNIGVGVFRLPCHYLITCRGLDGGMKVSVENKDVGISPPASWKEQSIRIGETKLFELGAAGGDLSVAYEGKVGTDLAFTITLEGVREKLLRESHMLDHWARCISEPVNMSTGITLVSVSEGPHLQKASAIVAGPMEQWVGFSRIGSPSISPSALSAAFAEKGLESVNSISIGSDSIKEAVPADERPPELRSIEQLLNELRSKLAIVREKSVQ